MSYDSLTGSARPLKTAEIVANRIRKAIVTGQLADGDRLPHEAKLTEDFSVSRPTIREAIRILEAEGLIHVVRGAKGGARVNPPGPEQIARAMGIALQTRGVSIGDLYLARSMIEPPAAREAARVSSAETVRVLTAQVEKERALTNDLIACGEAVAEFHFLLLERSGNLTMSIVGRALHDVSALHMQTYYRDYERSDFDTRRKTLEIGFRSQEKLIKLIRNKQPEEAAAHWKRHMHAAGKVWLNGLREKAIVDIL